MRKLVLATLILALPAISHARDSLDGCGLGWDVTDAETMIGTTTRGTTNVFVPPAFGMTTGTLGCKKTPFAANEREAVNYVASNFVNLKQQLASGQGEYVEGMAEVMKCDKVSSIRENYNTVVAPAKDGFELYQNLKSACAI